MTYRAAGQPKTIDVKKNIDIFNFKQLLLSLDMKTKVIQHVESDRMRELLDQRTAAGENEAGVNVKQPS